MADWEGLNPPYATIVADPPWWYSHRPGRYRPGENSEPAPNLAMPYSTMTVDAIAALPVRDLVASKAHLYLWATQRHLRDAFGVVDAWGFTASSILVWSKPPKGIVGTFVCSTEFCLFARRGVLPAKSKHLGTCFEWPRTGHSVKPPAFFDIVERVSPGPYVELFARAPRLGWDSWGKGYEMEVA